MRDHTLFSVFVGALQVYTAAGSACRHTHASLQSTLSSVTVAGSGTAANNVIAASAQPAVASSAAFTAAQAADSRSSAATQPKSSLTQVIRASSSSSSMFAGTGAAAVAALASAVSSVSRSTATHALASSSAGTAASAAAASSYAPLTPLKSKRGIISDLESSTYARNSKALTNSQITELSWYYSFGQYPDKVFSDKYPFTMQQFGIDQVATSDGNNFKNIKDLAKSLSETPTSLLFTFLEPAIHGIKVDDAISTWKQFITPLRTTYPNLKIGSPQVINGPDSLPWIRDFISKCPVDCRFDFLDVHYYDTSSSFQQNIKDWHGNFPAYPMVISDIGFQSFPTTGPECKQGDSQCVPNIIANVKWMEAQPYIDRFTFRGEFAPSSPLGQYGWSFLDDNGQYTELGKFYLGIA